MPRMGLFQRLFPRKARTSSPPDGDPLVITHVPALVALLHRAEEAKGAPLTEQEVLTIRDRGACIAMPRSVVAAVAEKRSYEDLDPERVWEHWQVARNRPYVGSAAETNAMWPGVNAVDWLVPWHPVKDGAADDGVARELYSELSLRHVLYGIPAREVGHRQDCDDVLFELLDGSGRFAVVHLTYAQHPEPDPFWPETMIYADWAQFERDRMRPDAAEWGT